jgi:hypothetical protein
MFKGFRIFPAASRFLDAVWMGAIPCGKGCHENHFPGRICAIIAMGKASYAGCAITYRSQAPAGRNFTRAGLSTLEEALDPVPEPGFSDRHAMGDFQYKVVDCEDIPDTIVFSASCG